jgi:DNA-binding transcriptional MerR regulator
MRITETSKKTGASTDEIRYFEAKGYISSNRQRIRTREVRKYSNEDIRMIETLVKYRREGFELNTAYEKAIQEIQQPYLIE